MRFIVKKAVNVLIDMHNLTLKIMLLFFVHLCNIFAHETKKNKYYIHLFKAYEEKI